MTFATFFVFAAWLKHWKEADSELQRLAEDRHKSKLMIVWVERLEDIGKHVHLHHHQHHQRHVVVILGYDVTQVFCFVFFRGLSSL